MLLAELSHHAQRVFRPANAHGVMRIGKHQQAAFFIISLLKVGLFKGVNTTLALLQRTVSNLSTQCLGGEEEGVIDRRNHHYLLVGLHKQGHGHGYSLHHTGHEAQPLRLYVPMLMGEQPVVNGRIIVFRHHGIAQDGMFQPLAQGVENVGAHRKVHVGHPHREQVIASPAGLERPMHQVARPLSGDDRIKIVFTHCFCL